MKRLIDANEITCKTDLADWIVKTYGGDIYSIICDVVEDEKTENPLCVVLAQIDTLIEELTNGISENCEEFDHVVSERFGLKEARNIVKRELEKYEKD